MELLIVTSSWPNVTVPEFLDDEILHLAKVFDRIVVAPMRPRAAPTPPLPQQVTVDYTLAQHVVHTRLSRSQSSRWLTAAVRGARPNRHGFGYSARGADRGLARSELDPIKPDGSSRLHVRGHLGGAIAAARCRVHLLAQPRDCGAA